MIQNYKHYFELPNGKPVFVQTEVEAVCARTYMRTILHRWHPPQHLYHFKRGGHISALKRHVNSRYFCTVDIENFFGTVKRNRIVRALQRIGLRYEQSLAIARRSTVSNRCSPPQYCLPFGFVQSMMLASLVLDKSAAGHWMRALKPESIIASCYVDDIILSALDPNELGDARAELVDNLARSAFIISDKKSSGVVNAATVFNITIGHRSMHIAAERFGQFIEDMSDPNLERRRAIVRYVSAVNEQQAQFLARKGHLA